MIEAALLLALSIAVAAHQRASALADWQRAVLGALTGAVSRSAPAGPLDDPRHAADFVRDVVATGVQNWRTVLDFDASAALASSPPQFIDGKAVFEAILAEGAVSRGVA